MINEVLVEDFILQTLYVLYVCNKVLECISSSWGVGVRGWMNERASTAGRVGVMEKKLFLSLFDQALMALMTLYLFLNGKGTNRL